MDIDRLMRITENEVLVDKGKPVFTEQYLFDQLFDVIFEKTTEKVNLWICWKELLKRIMWMS